VYECMRSHNRASKLPPKFHFESQSLLLPFCHVAANPIPSVRSTPQVRAPETPAFLSAAVP
jgi:hypothetical protein